MILNTHKEGLENASFTNIANEFCWENDLRVNSFGMFSDSDIICQHCVKKKESVTTQTSGCFGLWLFVSKYKVFGKWCSMIYYSIM